MGRTERSDGAYVVELWNRLVPIGTSVTLQEDDGQTTNTHTASIAWMVGGDPVVKVSGRRGGYLLWRIMPTEGPNG